MALRELQSSGEVSTSGGLSAASGLPTFWDSADTAPRTEWVEWWDLLSVATNTKYSISVTVVLRDVTEQQPRSPALLNNLNEQAAERKIVNVLFLCLVSAARKSLTDKFPHITVATVSLREIKANCGKAFQKPRNRTLERYKFFTLKQNTKESLRNFWHTLTGMAAKCDFDEQTDSLIMDTFIQKLIKKPYS